MPTWNPWHGCDKISAGCLNCYVYRRDEEFGKDSSLVTQTTSFDLPLKRIERVNISCNQKRERFIPA